MNKQTFSRPVMTMTMMIGTLVSSVWFATGALAVERTEDDLLIPPPKHGYISRLPASKWEEAMLTGNGTTGALVMGDPKEDRIILSHEKLFMPEYPPYPAPPLHKYLDQIRKHTLDGKGEQAAELLVEAGREVGIDGMIWTNALIPACQLEVKALSDKKVLDYARSVNYETGEVTTAWKTNESVFRQSLFFSRADGIAVLRLSSSKPGSLNFRFRLSQLPRDEEEAWEDEEDDEGQEISEGDDLIKEVKRGARGKRLFYSTVFAKQWEGSLKGFNVEARIRFSGGNASTQAEWIAIRKANKIEILIDTELSHSLPLKPIKDIDKCMKKSYSKLLKAHKKIHAGMFNRFVLQIGDDTKESQTAEEMVAASSFGKLKPELVNQLCEASRYVLISSTGEIPPTLQGIWGGTWRPAWSSDFTLNGNVPSVIACGLNTNLQELTESYLNMMWSMRDDFRDNARGMYKAPGLFVPSRASSSGKTYHYGSEYPHLFWFAGNAWTSQIFYDYWQYTGNEEYLKERTIPFMLESIAFYEFILTENEEDGKYMFLPSYSPELGPRGKHPVSVNATMDVAGLKQLLRNLLTLSIQGWITSDKIETWKKILENLPDYMIDKHGELQEWLWPGLRNNNSHRHASHLYPLFYEVDPDFINNPKLQQAAMTAIEQRMQYRRENNGAEMAFGLVQKGLAAAHIEDTAHAYECVDWLCNSYWSPALTSYHDPGSIFNVDICGGLPALVADMLVQSSAETIELLPACPKQWPEGNMRGVKTRCGVTVDLVWKDHKPIQVTLSAQRNTMLTLKYQDRVWPRQLKKGEVIKVTPFAEN